MKKKYITPATNAYVLQQSTPLMELSNLGVSKDTVTVYEDIGFSKEDAGNWDDIWDE